MFLSNSGRFLDDTWCGNVYPGICKIPLSTTNAPILQSSAAKCRSGWFLFVNSCYKLYQIQIYFAQAESFCSQRAIGSYLVEINSDLELSFLQSTFLDNIIRHVWVSKKINILFNLTLKTYFEI